MSTELLNRVDLEQFRRAALEELIAENGDEYLDRFRPGTFGCHELVERAHLFAEIVESRVLEHPACVQNAHWYELAERAVAALNELYQKVGADHLGNDDVASAKD